MAHRKRSSEGADHGSTGAEFSLPGIENARSRRKLSAVIADSIAESILEQGLAPGDQLPAEHEMLAHFDVGRASLREALRLLEADGLIVIKAGPGGGPVVSRPNVRRLSRLILLYVVGSGGNLRQIYETRKSLEPSLARAAAVNGTPEEIERIKQALYVMSGNVDNEVEFVKASAHFHGAIAEAAHNPAMLALSGAILRVVDGSNLGISRRSRSRIIDRANDIADAIERNAPEAAFVASNHHIDIAIEYFKHKFPGQFDEPIHPSTITQLGI